MPVGARTYSEALEMCTAVYRASSQVLTAAGYSTLKADEGGFGPAVSSHREALGLLQDAVKLAGLQAATRRRLRARRGGNTLLRRREQRVPTRIREP